jgi:hypothetical protein
MSVISELADPPAGGVIGFGPKVSVSPKGTPTADRETGEEKPLEDPIVTVADVKAIGGTITSVGETVIVKSPNPTTFKLRNVE